MGHNIGKHDNVVLANNQPAWHNLGVVLPDKLLTTEQVIAHALNWKVYQEPVVTTQGKILEGQYINIRSDTHEPLGVVGARYNVFQNSDAFKFMDDIMMDPHGPKYVTAGSLFNGRKVWLLAKFPEGMHIGPDDKIDHYLFLAAGHDGLTPVTTQWTTTRVVCWNTFSMAMRETDQASRRWTFRHFDRDYIKDAQTVLGIINDNRYMMQDILTKLTAVEPTEDEVLEVLTKLYPSGATVATTEEEMATSKSPILKVQWLWKNGMGSDMAHCEKSAYGLFQAITERTDHYARYKDDQNKLMSVMAGRAADLKTEALALLTDMYLR